MQHRAKQVWRRQRHGLEDTLDWLASEEPLELRIEGKPTAVLLRTPGDDLDLVAGFLNSEGVIDGIDDIRAMAHIDDPADPKGNTVDVVLSGGVPLARKRKADREFFASSSCGVCGKASIDKLLQKTPDRETWEPVLPELIAELPRKLSDMQKVFKQTGGLHAAALFDNSGELIVMREDIGRHNAVDKVIGHCLRHDRWPISETILLVSGRAGFEIVQKALMANIGILAAIGAPSAMAADLAHEGKMRLIGFLRDGRYNLYGALK